MKAVFALLWLVAAESSAAQVPTLKYTVVQKYGWEELTEATRPLSARERRLNGGVLGSVGNFAVGPDGRLYIPDGAMHKVVVFERSGALVSVLGGEGDGPGELRNPFAAAVSAYNVVYVYDVLSKKVTGFAASGAYRSRFQFPGDLISNLVWADGSLFAARWAPTQAKVVIRIDPERGSIQDSAVVLSEPESKLYKNGSGPILSVAMNVVYLASPSAGLWYSVKNSRKSGRARYPDARPYERTMGSMRGVRAVTDRSLGFAVRRDGSVIAVYAHRTKLGQRAGETPEEVTYLEIIRPNGSSGGRIAFPAEQQVYGMAIDGDDVLLGVTDEIPQVWRLRFR